MIGFWISLGVCILFVLVGTKHEYNKGRARKSAPVIQLNDYRKDAA